MDNILICCDSIERYYFFKRFSETIKNRVNFITSEPVVLLMARYHGFKCYYINIVRQPDVSNDDSDLLYSIEVLNQSIDADRAYSYALSIKNRLKAILESVNITCFVIWNGQQIIGKVLTDFANDNDISCLYLELSNLPNKIFVDSQGVNAKSSIKKLTEWNDVAQSEHENWLRFYEKEKSKVLPQSKISIKKSFLSLINYFLKVLLDNSNRSFSSIFRMRNKFQKCGDDVSLNEVFIFLPLQVTSDTQIKINSTVDNIDAIKYSVKMAERKGLKLYVKIHPAEVDNDFISKVTKLKNDFGFYITNLNTVDLLKCSQEVVTINSTVGIEALIYKKPLTILGKAFYKDFSQVELRKYIHSFLVDGIDYFSEHAIDENRVKEILDRRFMKGN